MVAPHQDAEVQLVASSSYKDWFDRAYGIDSRIRRRIKSEGQLSAYMQDCIANYQIYQKYGFYETALNRHKIN